ncbi:hypothetical protein BH11PSE11_BH11PSE11_18760 [soil metagenome]
MSDDDKKSPEAIAKRKEYLQAQGAVYRLQIVDAKMGVTENLRPAALAHNALNSIGRIGASALGGGKLGNLRTILPFVVSGIAAVSKRAVIKPLFRGILVIGAVAAVASVVNKRRKARKLGRLQAESQFN